MIRYFVIPLILSLVFIFESIFLAFVPSYGLANQYVLAPHFIFVTLLFCAVFYHRNSTLIYAFIFGFIFDIFYTSLIGVYAYLFPLTVYLLCKLIEPLHKMYLIVFVFAISGTILIEFTTFGIHAAVGHSIFGFEDFMYMRLWPTLITNIVFTLVFGYVLQRIFMKLSKIDENKE